MMLANSNPFVVVKLKDDGKTEEEYRWIENLTLGFLYKISDDVECIDFRIYHQTSRITPPHNFTKMIEEVIHLCLPEPMSNEDNYMWKYCLYCLLTRGKIS